MTRRIYPILWPYYRNTKCPRCLRPKARGRVHLRLCDTCTEIVQWFRSRRVVEPQPQRTRFIREEARRLASMRVGKPLTSREP